MPNHDRWNDGEFALSDHLSHYRKNRSINLRGQSKHYWKWKFREREREREREITWFVGEPKNQTKNSLIYFSLSLKPTHNPYLTKKKKKKPYQAGEMAKPPTFYYYCKVTNCSQNPKELGYKPNTINL